MLSQPLLSFEYVWHQALDQCEGPDCETHHLKQVYRDNKWIHHNLEDLLILDMDPSDREPIQEEQWKWCRIKQNTYSCSMKLDRLLSPMLKIGKAFDSKIDVRLEDHQPLGYWVTVAALNAEEFFKHFGDKDFYNKWDEVTLREIIHHKPHMTPHDRSLELEQKLKQVACKLEKEDANRVLKQQRCIHL